MGYTLTKTPTKRKEVTRYPAKETTQHQRRETPVDCLPCDHTYCGNNSGVQLANDHTHVDNSKTTCSKTTCYSCDDIFKENIKLKAKIKVLQGNTNSDKTKSVSSVYKFVNTDEKVNRNTGIKDCTTLHGIHSFLAPKIKQERYWVGNKIISLKKNIKKCANKPGPKSKLSAFEELVIVLMKLRLGVTNTLLCDTFCISSGLFSKILNTWIPFLAKQLRNLVVWPDKEVVRQHMPA